MTNESSRSLLYQKDTDTGKLGAQGGVYVTARITIRKSFFKIIHAYVLYIINTTVYILLLKNRNATIYFQSSDIWGERIISQLIKVKSH